jgi:hypothetical protein
MGQGIFLTVKDLMKLTGSNNYNSTANSHRTIRHSITQKKRKLTIKEYCDYEVVDFEYVWKYLREAKNKHQ